MNKIFLFLFLVCNAGLVFGNPPTACINKPLDYYIIDGLNEDNSVIKIWFTTLGLLDEYDQNQNAGFEIAFDGNGKHYSAERGPNWWDYFFKFHSVGSAGQGTAIRVPRHKRSTIRFKAACTMKPERGNYLLNKYMSLQPALKARFEQIRQKYWPQNGPVVGIYYQKPLMPEVQPLWNSVMVSNRIKQDIKNLETYKLIVFTELEDFAKDFSTQFPSECVCIAELINHTFTSPAEKGEHELLTLLLLAECDIVIAPGSYQGIGAKMLNPNLQLIEFDPFPYAIK